MTALLPQGPAAGGRVEGIWYITGVLQLIARARHPGRKGVNRKDRVVTPRDAGTVVTVVVTDGEVRYKRWDDARRKAPCLLQVSLSQSNWWRRWSMKC